MIAWGYATFTGGWNWQGRWFSTTSYLARLRTMYANPTPSVDLLAVINSFMIDCAHMWDAFKNDESLPAIGREQVQAAMDGDDNLQLCRDYANTYKHLRRAHQPGKPLPRVAELWQAGSSSPTTSFATICYGPLGSDPASRPTIDALELAEAAYAAWRAFMFRHGIEQDQTSDTLPAER